MRHRYRSKWYHSTTRWIYSLALLVLIPLLSLKLLTKKAKSDKLHKHKNRQRLGFFPSDMKKGGVIFHCVSIGELNAAKAIVEHILCHYPSLPVTITTTSVTAAEQAEFLFADKVQHTFLPLDLPILMSKMLNTLKPKVIIITEVEIWPNLLQQCYLRKIPSILVNGRMTDSSLHNYKKLAFLFRPSLRKFNRIGAQGSTDFENFVKLGVYKQNIKVTNNLKFDIEQATEDTEKSLQLRKQFDLDKFSIVLGASTHEGEEAMLIDAFEDARKQDARVRLCLVPRYPHRFEEVTLYAKARGLCAVTASGEKIEENWDVLILDKMGWLKAAYSVCDIAFVGGSFVSRGGHNPLEAALYKKPILMGPSYYNNVAIVEKLSDAGALQRVNKDKLNSVLTELVSRPSDAKEMGQQGFEVIQQNKGAITETIKLVEPFLA